jgi:glycine/D-amino acid oxidase-like deaminating enzyme
MWSGSAYREALVFCPLDDPSPLPGVYSKSAGPGLEAPPLSGSASTEVAIIGGGLTGLSAALHLAERKIGCVLVEARQIGDGGSGRAFGQVVPYAKHDSGHILAHFGQDAGARLIDALTAGPDYLFDLVRRYDICCDAQHNGLIFAANSPAGARSLEKRARYWQQRGAPVDLLDANAAQREIGSSLYPLALLDHRGGLINPLAYTRGVARAAQQQGAKLHEYSRATGLQRRGRGWVVKTKDGMIDARFVLLAAGAYTDDVWPGLRASIVPMRAYQLVTEPLSDNVRGMILPGGRALTDTRRLYSGIRLLPDGRLHLSVDGPAFDSDGDAFRSKSEARLRRVFPQAAGVGWSEAWSGWVDMTGDQYPHVHELAAGVWAVIGLSGRGLVFSTLLGREMAQRFAGVPEPELFMPVTSLRALRLRPIAAPLVRSLMQAYRLLDRMESMGYLRSRPHSA